ncbi:zinc finger domain-like protein [Leptomonas pyrrhocoris]|uniref:Palmitoyltransferase n=1 Tax=Leptomonas pyrrhocoris TaxID=157538 RepID=A0A0M9FY52_LEPPY|nr:zinc finger domain-like protein [Leptomonas pyrrhocoris]KPA78327.1 zinc finger domain-like protein [Leptomonas pyrrhocoris]|eukprot:XP_015656766.1 zinc finger domain-like protein [Leptomonas pyrrhocoris]
MDNGALLNYALKRHNFLAAMWLTLQQRWFARSFNVAARVLSWFVILLGMTLVTFTVVTIARNVAPVLTTPRSAPYYLLQSLVVFVSFNVYFNYFCATAFSRRVGTAPAGYVYRDPYGADPAALPADNSSDDEDDVSGEDDANAAAVSEAAADGHTRQPFSSWQHRQVGLDSHSTAHTFNAPTSQSGSGLSLHTSAGMSSRKPSTAAAAAAGAAPAPPSRFGGIQVMRVFREAVPPSPTPQNNNSNTSGVRAGGAAVPNTAATPPRAAASFSPFPKISPQLDDAMEVEVEEASEDGDHGRRTRPLFLSYCLAAFPPGRCVPHCWRRLFEAGGTRVCRTLAHSCPKQRCSRLSVCSCGAASSSTVAPMNVLRELELLAATAERCGPRQRAARVLDAPRRYCRHCRRLKAPREHHCAICNECVAKMDHHCPWINNCVDVENQRYFLLFIAWLWLGTLLATGFVGCGMARQHRYTTRRDTLYQQWLRSPANETLARELQRLRMPYGPSGVLLTSYPTVMVLGISITMFFCMTFFIYFNRRLVLENTTVIESIYVDEKRHHVYRSTSVAYRSPYDLGPWLNFLDLFSPAGDPMVQTVTENLRSSSGGAVGSSAAQRRGLLSRLRTAASRVGVALWLTACPTLRATHSDGVHYTTFDALASGEQTSLLRS